jgi:molybdate transport system regulatory protein
MTLCFRGPVVETAKGGQSGGGAQLTELGKEAVKRFRMMENHAAQAIEDDLKGFRKLLNKQKD